jgi:hypothetical protein
MINGNYLAEAGLRRIARPIIMGLCTSIVRLEMFANEPSVNDLNSYDWETDAPMIKILDEDERVNGVGSQDWRERLATAIERNNIVYDETRWTALKLLATSRILFGGNVSEAEIDVKEIINRLQPLSLLDNFPPAIAYPTSCVEQQPRSLSQADSFPFLRLPVELREHVVRSLTLLTPSSYAHPYPRSATTPSDIILSSPITESQLLSIVAYATSPTTLTREIMVRKDMGQVNVASRMRSGFRSALNSIEEDSWEEIFLKSTGCDRFMRS